MSHWPGDVWITRRQPFMRNILTRIGFIDVETGEEIDPGDQFPRRGSLKTNMAKTTGWSPCGTRLVDHAPFGHWQTRTPDHPCFRRGRLRGRL